MAFWSDLDLKADFTYDQETIYKKISGVIYAVIQRLRVKTSSLNGEDYDCVVQGNGEIKDYGPSHGTSAPKILIHCKKSQTQSIIWLFDQPHFFKIFFLLKAK